MELLRGAGSVRVAAGVVSINSMKTLKKVLLSPEILITLVVLALVSLPFLFSDLDLLIAAKFYDQDGWFFLKYAVSEWLYHLSLVPGLLITAYFTFVFVFGLFSPRLARRRKLALVVMITMGLGPGLFINGLLKNGMNRPRPAEIKRFGGTREYRGLLAYSSEGRGKSFACGHASVGFVLTALFFAASAGAVFRWTGLATGILLGLLIGLLRIAQGAHFASDVLWAGGVTFLCAALASRILDCFPALFPENVEVTRHPFSLRNISPARLALGAAVLLVFSLFLVGFGLVAVPYRVSWSRTVAGTENLKKIRFIRLPEYDVSFLQTDQEPALTITADLKGFGLPGVVLREELDVRPDGDGLTVSLNFGFDRFITEKSGRVEIRTGKDLPLEIRTVNRYASVVLGSNRAPGNFGELDIFTRHGNIAMNMPDGSTLAGGLGLGSETGDLKLNLGQSANPGRQPWRLTTNAGNIQLKVRQRRAQPEAPALHLTAESRAGSVTIMAETIPQCPFSLSLPGGPVTGGVKTAGAWLQTADRISNSALVGRGINISVLSGTGKVFLDLNNAEPGYISKP